MGVVVGVFVGLQIRRGISTDVLFLMALMIVTMTGVINPHEALAGFSNPAVLTIAGLLAVAAGLRTTGVLDWVGQHLLGSARTERAALLRLAPTLIAASAFMLNTALVAMMMPVVIDWCRRRNLSPSRLLMPLSYLVILGGVCTLIGTSTTLVVNGILRDQHANYMQGEQTADIVAPERTSDTKTADTFAVGIAPMSLFELGKVGLPCAVVGGLFLLTFGPSLLPNRTDIVEQVGEKRREYLVELFVQDHCSLIGKSIEEAGLRHLPGLFLIEIDRAGEVITPVSPENKIQSADRLVFTGIVSTIVDLEKIPGLVPVAESTSDETPVVQRRRHLTEVVLSRTSPLIGTTVRDANFRQRYNAAVVAVHRNGVRLTNKIGNIELEPGDTLLLQTRGGFVRNYRNSRDFYLVSAIEGSEPRRHEKMAIAAVLLGVLIVWLSLTSWLGTGGVTAGISSTAIASLAVACMMILMRCMRVSDARAAIDLQMLITIAAALGLGKALTASGAANLVADTLVGLAGQQPWLLLVIIYLLAVCFTETISNNAVAAMLIPIAIALAFQGGLNPRPFIMAVSLAASLSFITPIGYQTNLMVMGPGGYRPRDYLKCGLPLAIVVAITAMLLIPPFYGPLLP